MQGKGPLVTINDAAKMAEIHKATISKYVQEGWLDLQFEGTMVYYRDLLRASWIAKQNQMKNAKNRTLS